MLYERVVDALLYYILVIGSSTLRTGAVFSRLNITISYISQTHIFRTPVGDNPFRSG